MSSSCKILICLVQNACRKKCCLLIQHVTLIFMFALIKYIFDCLWLVSQIFLTLIYFILLTNKQVTFFYSQITCWIKSSPPPSSSSLTTTFASLLEQRLPKKKKSLGNKWAVKHDIDSTEQDCKDLNDVNDSKEVHVLQGQGNFLIP